MNKRQKEVLQAQLNAERAVLKQLEKNYRRALHDVEERVKLFDFDLNRLDSAMSEEGLDDTTKAMLQSQRRSRVYQKQYQEALRGQISGILDKLHGDEYATIQQYLDDSYTSGFVGTMYDIAGQGVPLILPIDQAAAVRAVQLESKVKKGFYDALGVDITKLKKTINAEVSRGIATGMNYSDIARNINSASRTGLSNAKRIARTEGHRIQQASTMDAQNAAKAKGADVVKMWDSTMDGNTRSTHRQLDGQIREIDEDFEVGGMKAKAPGYFGRAGEDINCRCVSLTRARWALDEDELATLKKRAEYFGLDKTASFEDYTKKYLKIGLSSGKSGDTDGYTTIDEVIAFNFSDKKAMRKEIDSFVEQYADAEVEHAFVFSPSGKLYKLTGTSVSVNTELVGDDDLVGSICIHNHPVDKGYDKADSFSVFDVRSAVEHKTGMDFLVSGSRRESFVYTGSLTADELVEEYEKAIKKALEIALNTGGSVEYWQEAAMMGLAENVEGFVFYEDIRF